jgi:glutamyl-tRNA synthetase
MTKVRVRFAPSPTGFFHIGSARTALFNWLYARHTGGTMVLRIEDTDHERNTPEALDHLLRGMRWLGLDWDEGPEVGGPFGPYFQSQREHVYREYLEQLKKTGRTYEQDGAVYFKVSGQPQLIQDQVRGDVERLEEKDFVIVRSNGMPVFHFVNVVDDIAMETTHIIRGEDHLSNTSKHVELFKAFGAPLPLFAHIPLILKTHGSGKMSKRDQGALVEEYQKRHYLPEALRNFLCLLGWSPKDDREILPIEEIIKLFDLHGINKNNAHFDDKKLAHINGEYVRMIPMDRLVTEGKQILKDAGLLNGSITDAYIADVLKLAQEKMKGLEDIPTFLRYFFTDNYGFDEEAHQKIFKKGEPLGHLKAIHGALQATSDFSDANLEAIVNGLAQEHGTGTGSYIQVTRFALSGMSVGPSFYGLLRVLGKERVLSRLERFLKGYPSLLQALRDDLIKNDF